VQNGQLFLGIDIGSTTIKAVLMTDKGKVRHTMYQRTRPMEEGGKVTCTSRCGQCGKCNLGALKKTLDAFVADAGVKQEEISSTVVTGSQIVEDTIRFVPFDFQVSEVSAHVAGALHYYPDCRAILDVGGQDSKAMIYNEQMQMWTSKMNGVCAAGTGAFLDNVAHKLNIPVEEMADKVNYDSTLEFSSVCAVLAATSVNKFKNRYPIGDVIGAACRAQARTIMSGVGELLYNYKGDIIFQGGVASNRAVAHYLKEITGNNIVIPEFHHVMGALGAANLARQHCGFRGKLVPSFFNAEDRVPLKSVGMRAQLTRKEFAIKKDLPLVWRNLFFPAEILNALGVRMLTLETYSALFARNQRKVKKYLDNASYKGYSAETCTFLRILEGMTLPKPDFAVSTSQPCQQGERIFQDLARSEGFEDRFYSLHTPIYNDANAVEHIAQGLEEAVSRIEKAIGAKMDMSRLQEACQLSNDARDLAIECNDLRYNSPPLVRGATAVYFAAIFSQLWGKKELVDIHRQFLLELQERKAELERKKVGIDDTHRLLWLHLPPFYDNKLLNYIEVNCNAPIVFEEVNYVAWDRLDLNDPYRSLARKLLTVGFLDPKQRVENIRDNAIKAKFNGCVLYNHGFGRCSMADSSLVKHLREELNKAHVPLLVLDGDCIDLTTDPCSTFTKVNAYTEALNLNRHGNIFGQVMEGKAGLLPSLQASIKFNPFSIFKSKNAG